MLGRLGSTLLQCSRFGRVSRSLNLFRLGIYDASDAGGLFEEMAVSVVAQSGLSAAAGRSCCQLSRIIPHRRAA